MYCATQLSVRFPVLKDSSGNTSMANNSGAEGPGRKPGVISSLL